MDYPSWYKVAFQMTIGDIMRRIGFDVNTETAEKIEGGFCRNPDGEPTIWCYTRDPNKRWEFCDPLQQKQKYD